MIRDERALVDEVLHDARTSGYGPGEFVGQEGFMGAGEILELGVRAGIGAEVPVLDLCCGVAGPGRHIARELRCRYTGVDANPAAVALARERAGGLDCRFLVGEVPPTPRGRFEVVLLLETMLAFRDKRPLLDGVAATLAGGGRFAFTVEEGGPLTAAEREAMPHSGTVWPIPLERMRDLLARAGLAVTWQGDCTDRHRATAASLLQAYTAHAAEIASVLGRQALEDLLTGHRLWVEWLGSGRMRKFAMVAEKPAPVPRVP